MNNLIPAGLKFVGQQKHMQMHKAAFAGGCKVIIRYIKSKMRTRNLRGNPDDQDDELFVSYARHFKLFNDHFYDFFEAINFEDVKIGLFELHAARFQKLKQELELPCTRIIFNGEMSIKNLPLINDALLASKVFKDINVTQTLYIEKDRVIDDETKLLGDSKHSKKSFSTTKSHKYTVDANEIVEVFTKTKDAKLEPRSCTKETKTNDALNKISIVGYTKQIPVKKSHSTISLLVDDIMKVNNSKYGSLHKITIACKSNLTHIHIFYHTSNRSNVERITVFCDTLYSNQKDVTTTKDSRMLCLDNIPNSILDDLYMNLCVLQYTNAPVFVFPNVWTTQQSQITYADRVVSSGDLLRNTRIAYSKYFKSYNQDDSYSMPYCDSMNRLMYTYKHGSYFDASLKHFFERFLGLTKADFDQIICKSVFNMDSFGPKVDDPFILDDHRTTQEVQFYAMQPNEQTILLYVVVRRDVYDMINMFNHGINFLEKFLGDESYKSTFSNYTEIEKYVGMDKKLFTLILNDLSKLGFFDSIAQECEITEKSYKLDLLSRVDSLFDKNEHHGQGDSDSKLSPKSMFALALEPLIELDIDEMLKTIFEEKKKLMPQAKAKISYFKILKTGKNSGANSVEVVKDKGKMEYRNLEHLDIETEYEKEKVWKQTNCAIM